MFFLFDAAYKKTIVFPIFSLWAVSVGICAGEVRTPDFIADVEIVSADGVINLIEQTDEVIIVDSRISGDRKLGYLESSVSLPDSETSCSSLAKILPDKMHPALFYCNGVKCGRSAIAIKVAKKCGYKKLYWFRGGFEEWLEKGFPFLKK